MTDARLGALTLGVGLLFTAAAPPRVVAAAGTPYLIGAAVSESGPGASLGRPEADSIQMAVDEINAAGGVDGHPLKVTILDDQSDPTTAVNEVRQLLGQHVIAIIGSSLTQTSMAMVKDVQDAGIPMISLASSAQIIEPVADHKWVFKMPITDTIVAKMMQSYMKRHNETKVGFVYRNDDYGKTGLQHFEDAAGSSMTVLDPQAIDARASDATTQLTHVKAANPQATVVWSTLPSVTVIMKGYRELGLTPPIYFSDGAANGAFLQQAGPGIDGAFIASTKVNVAELLPASDPQKKILDHYIAAFSKAYPKDLPISIFGGFGYDAVEILKSALERAHTSDPAKLRDAIEHTTYDGVSGLYRITPTDHNGLAEDSLVLTQVKGQKFTLVK
ncbi:MAG TPA: ABC transporter substrate-binding protein [Candidatus Sulfotelmatobacter sp.]|nr:ABC transporter substrate-binding protein [Candidatus Sulfotelmatobacter sp.]